MAWIESHQSLARHPKLYRLADMLKVSRATCLGHLHMLWYWTMEYAPSGDLSKFTAAEIAGAAEWCEDSEIFVSALKQSGWLEDDGFVHDWRDYAGKLIQAREKDRRRKRRSSGGNPVELHRHSDVPNPTQPNRTEPNPTAPNREQKTAACVEPSIELEALAMKVYGNVPAGSLMEWVGLYGEPWIKQAILETEASGKKSVSYTTGILRRYQRDGGPGDATDHRGGGASGRNAGVLSREPEGKFAGR